MCQTAGQAVPLPEGWFKGPRDERYGFGEGGYGHLRPEATESGGNAVAADEVWRASIDPSAGGRTPRPRRADSSPPR